MTLIDLQQIGPEAAELLFAIGNFAEQKGISVFLVGGPVRDLLMNQEVEDIDIMVRGDAIEFSKQLYQDTPWPGQLKPNKPVCFKKYGTSKLNFSKEVCPGIDSLDFASSRSEVYHVPGSAPSCQPGSLEQDLLRRDFSINAMAVSLSPSSLGELFDFHNGQEDLINGLIRVLHEKSFNDDPARLIRAVRFLERFNFALAPGTFELFQQAVRCNFVETLPKRRAFDELRKALKETRWLEIVVALQDKDILTQIDPRLNLWSLESLRLADVDEHVELEKWERRYMWLVKDLPVRDRVSLSELFNLSKSWHKKLEYFISGE
jgi:tRNA nucleotidyltransferase (CCA-adding enzyme)